MSLKAKIEAVLFLTSKPVRAQALSRLVNAELQEVKQAVVELVRDYEERKGALEITDEDGYSFQVKEEYASLMDEFLPVEMSAALLRTLSAIAIKQPISQSEIIRVRGAGAYDHIRELVLKDLVSKKDEQGERSPQLATTKKFQEYFRLTQEGKQLRTYLKKQVRKAEAAEAASNAASELQLSIPQVSPEADNQLNQGFFLETADYVEPDGADDMMAAAAQGTDLDYAAPVAGQIFQPEFPEPPSENMDTASQASTYVAPRDNAVWQMESDEPTNIGTTAQPELTSEAGLAVAEISLSPTPDVAAASGAVVEAGKTMAKLAKAAKSTEPKPLPVREEESAAEAGTVDAPPVGLVAPESSQQSSVPDVVAAPPFADDAPAESAGADVHAGSNIQARSVRRNEPPLASASKAKESKKRPSPLQGSDKLSDLLFKQKQLQRQLKLGLFSTDDGDTILDFESSSSSIEKAV